VLRSAQSLQFCNECWGREEAYQAELPPRNQDGYAQQEVEAEAPPPRPPKTEAAPPKPARSRAPVLVPTKDYDGNVSVSADTVSEGSSLPSAPGDASRVDAADPVVPSAATHVDASAPAPAAEKDELCFQPYFRPEIKETSQAKAVLSAGAPQNGSFICYQDSKDRLVLCVVHQDRPAAFQLAKDQRGLVVLNKKNQYGEYRAYVSLIKDLHKPNGRRPRGNDGKEWPVQLIAVDHGRPSYDEPDTAL